MSIAAIIAGLLLLYFGAEALIRGSVSLAARMGVSPFLIGLTVVAYGTSAPELVVGITANLGGHGDIAAGNVVGSNIFNVAVILGLSAILCPLKIRATIQRRDIPILAAVSAVPLLLFRDARVERIEGALLLAGIALYTFIEIRWARREPQEDTGGRGHYLAGSMARDLVRIIVGVAVLVAGSRLLTWGAVRLARTLGIGEAIIGLTIVSAGTSLPELAASVVAALRKHPELSVGNVIGSSMFNILGILGLSAVIVPVRCPGITRLDVLVMLFVTVLLLPLMRSRATLSRWEGAVLLAIYAAYLFRLWPSG